MNTEKMLKTPTNKKELWGQPLLFAEMPRMKLDDGDAEISYNIMTGCFFIWGQKGNSKPYLIDNIKDGIAMMKTVNHFNATGEKKAFKFNKLDKLVKA